MQNVSRVYIALKSLMKKDSSPLRQAIYIKYIEKSKVRKALKNLYSCLPDSLRMLSICFYIFPTLGKIPTSDEFIAEEIFLWEHKTELLTLKRLFGDDKLSISTKFSIKRLIQNVINFVADPGDFLIKKNFVKYLVKKYDLLIVARCMQFLLYYAFLRRIVSFHKIYISSDASPFSLSLIGNERFFTVYTPHGIIPYCNNLIPFSLSVFTSRYNYRQMQARCLFEVETYFTSEIPLFSKRIVPRSVGIVCSIIPNYEYIKEVAVRLRNMGCIVYIKRHPNEMSICNNIDFAQEVSSLEKCDFVLCGNSGHVMPLLKSEVLTLFDTRLDHCPDDIYGLLKDRLVIQFENLDSVGSAADYYNSEEWRRMWMQQL